MQTIRMVNSMESGCSFHSPSAFIESSVSAPDAFQRVCNKILQELSELSKGNRYTINAISKKANRAIAEENCNLDTAEVVANIRADLEERGIVIYAAGKARGRKKVKFDDGYEDIDPTQPTSARPGTKDKVLMLQARYIAGEPLWHDNDCYQHGPTDAQELAILNAGRLVGGGRSNDAEEGYTFDTGESSQRRT